LNYSFLLLVRKFIFDILSLNRGVQLIDFAHLAAVSEAAARAAGGVLLDWQGRAKVTAKAPADLVTEADFAAQECIRSIILAEFPAHDFLGEESETALEQRGRNSRSDFRWIVDPLDGTTNYVHQLPYYCVSVAVEHDGRIVAGTIYDPVHKDCFRATKGQGAYCNDQPISVSHVGKLADALTITGFPPRPDRDSIEVRRFVQTLGACQAVRRMGAAALNMCHLAAGHFDAYWANSVKIWDVAAGLLIIQEAGGIITAFDGGPFNLARPNLLAAGTAELHAELLEFFSRVK
jgi:myo-inositol-1(or 4)-monophosphatase